MIALTVNGRPVEVDVEPDTPLLWVLRDHLGLTGTRFGCGIGQCGACTVHLGSAAIRACTFPIGGLAGQSIRTIEGLGGDHPVQQAWIRHQVPQCGWCQSGQVMAAVALLQSNPRPDRAAIESFMTNICRCGTYDRIRRALLDLAEHAPASPEAPAPGEAEGASPPGEDMPTEAATPGEEAP